MRLLLIWQDLDCILLLDKLLLSRLFLQLFLQLGLQQFSRIDVRVLCIDIDIQNRPGWILQLSFLPNSVSNRRIYFAFLRGNRRANLVGWPFFQFYFRLFICFLLPCLRRLLVDQIGWLNYRQNGIVQMFFSFGVCKQCRRGF